VPGVKIAFLKTATPATLDHFDIAARRRNIPVSLT
jgi:hypothetical protein